MLKISSPLEFEWDSGNKDKNFLKHEVRNREAEEIFSSSPKYFLKDNKHSKIEKRYQIWGRTSKNRKLSIIFTIRSKKIRIISARDMNMKERRVYEKKAKRNTKI